MAEELLEGEAEAITRAVIEKAKAGDTTALRICLDRFAPSRKARAVAIDLPRLVTTTDALMAIANSPPPLPPASLRPRMPASSTRWSTALRARSRWPLPQSRTISSIGNTESPYSVSE